eukprot:m.223663 g.223663  ORF g.223663 m.223663 type:complete len:985 (-) comp26347_c0_seq5:19-2973(-)
MSRMMQKFLPRNFSAEFIRGQQWPALWSAQGYFVLPKQTCKSATQEQQGQPTPTNTFSLLFPPPNITGTLHLGHALTGTLQDTLTRRHRMLGHKTVWIPGMDHAGIATQRVVERHLSENNIRREDLGKEEFLKEVQKWKQTKSDRIREQLDRMGFSLDWSREYFTMDPHNQQAVTTAFLRLHSQGLIKRGKKIVNWSSMLNSVISDIEVEQMEVDEPRIYSTSTYEVELGKMYYFAYPIQSPEPTGPTHLEVATTRPETMVGDVALAISPSDQRYTCVQGKQVIHPLTGDVIPIICDEELVDPELGTGVVKVTPAHDARDYQAGQRHNLAMPLVLDERGHVPALDNQHRFEARKTVIQRLHDKGLFLREENHQMTVPICSRSGDIIEPRLCSQWFLDCSGMAKKARAAVESGDIVLFPSSHNTAWSSWLNSTEDWCISRQLWWGHRIPAYQLCVDGELVDRWIVAENETDALRQAKEDPRYTSAAAVSVVQDEDVLDTWFSSALLPFSSFGWPNEDPELDLLFPTNVLVTGSDIMFFWVARMVMMSLHLTGRVPFRQVLLHGMVRDGEGRKMSKSTGNVLDPLYFLDGIDKDQLSSQLQAPHMSPMEARQVQEFIQKYLPNGVPSYGDDVLRMTLLHKSHLVNIKLTLEAFELQKKFCNKVWHCFAFFRSSVADTKAEDVTLFQPGDRPSELNTWLFGQCAEALDAANTSFDKLRLHEASEHLRELLTESFSKRYLRWTQSVMKQGTLEEQRDALRGMLTFFDIWLRAFHPIAPFLTETLFAHLPDRSGKSLSVARYPTREEVSQLLFEKDEQLISFAEKVTAEIFSFPLLNHLNKFHRKFVLQTREPDLRAQLQRAVPLVQESLKHKIPHAEVYVSDTLRSLEKGYLEMPLGHNYSMIVQVSGGAIDKKLVMAMIQKCDENLEKIAKNKRKISTRMAGGGYSNAPDSVKEQDNSKLELLTQQQQEIARAQEFYQSAFANLLDE